MLNPFADPTPEVTKAESIKYARWENYNKFKAHKALLQGFNTLLCYMPGKLAQDLGLSMVTLRKVSDAYKEQHLLQSRTFTVCPTCDKALTSKKRRKVGKTSSEYNCNICDKPSGTYTPGQPYSYANRKICHSLSLADSKTYLHTNFPELYL